MSHFSSLQCPISHCQTIKNVLQHMPSCQLGRSCQEPHCSSNQEIFKHWRVCNNDDCPVCKPYKKPVTVLTGQGTNPSNIGNNIQPSVSFQNYSLFLLCRSWLLIVYIVKSHVFFTEATDYHISQNAKEWSAQFCNQPSQQPTQCEHSFSPTHAAQQRVACITYTKYSKSSCSHDVSILCTCSQFSKGAFFSFFSGIYKVFMLQ